MSYGGETNAKRLARACFWMSALEDPNFMLKHHKNMGRFLVLCGPERGDVTYLDARLSKLKYKSPHDDDELIIAVDEDVTALEQAIELEDTNLHTHVVYKHAPVLEVAKEYRHQFSVIYLDFCANISSRTLEEAVSVAAAGMRDNGLFAMTLMMGRENNGLMELLEKGNYGGSAMLSEHISKAGQARAEFVWDQMRDRMARFNRGVLVPKGVITYSSGKEKNGRNWGGVPMLTMWWHFIRPHKPMNTKQYVAWEFRTMVKELSDKAIRVQHFGSDIGGNELRLAALQLKDVGHSTDNIGRILNLPPRKLSAWFAVDTIRRRREEDEVARQA